MRLKGQYLACCAEGCDFMPSCQYNNNVIIYHVIYIYHAERLKMQVILAIVYKLGDSVHIRPSFIVQ